MPFPHLVSGFACITTVCLATSVAMVADVELPDYAPVPHSREEALRQTAQVHEKPAPAAMPADERACQKELRALGVAFTAAPAVEARDGCALPFPLKVSALSPKIDLQPPAVINCATARAAARLFQDAGMAAAKKYFNAEISSVKQASGYVCRPIHDSEKLSEHAFGNALDVSGIVLSGLRHVDIHEYKDDGSAEAKFLNEIRAAACGPFTTVLGPGTDADHAGHFHFDMKKRSHDPYCE